MNAATEDAAPDDCASAKRSRLPELDALRGAAIVAMVIWHAADAWLHPAYRSGAGWHTARVIGGLAAPAFLFVAGASVAIALERGRPAEAIARRGLALVALGGALRLAQWSIDSAGLLSLRGLALALLAAAPVTLLLRGTAAARTPARWTAALVSTSVAYVAAVLLLARDVAPALLRFDVLHCIGVAVIASAYLARAPRPAWLAALALTLLGLTPTLSALTGGAPALAWLARESDASGAPWASFPLAPNLAFAMLGAFGASVRSRVRAPAVGALALVLAIALFEGGLPITRRLLDQHPVARPHVHAGFVITALVAAGALTITLARHRIARRALVPLGRHSLLIYALHLELVYGLLAIPVARALPPAAVFFGGVIVLSAASWIGDAWSRRGRPPGDEIR